VRRGIKAATPAVTGIVPAYGFMRNIIAEAGGRFINDPRHRRAPAGGRLGNELAKLLFEQEPRGTAGVPGRHPVHGGGVMRPKLQNSSYQQRDQDRIFIPATTHYALFATASSTTSCTAPAARS